MLYVILGFIVFRAWMRSFCRSLFWGGWYYPGMYHHHCCHHHHHWW